MAALADRYAVERELGQGGMAAVYLARDLKHDRQVAVKVMRPEIAAELGAERFLREIQVVARLQHPHILPLYDSGEKQGFLYYVMPLVAGESLRQRLEREKQLPVEDALEIARSVAAALDYAHRHDVIHRDIKPENIMLHEGEAVVADFGIAKAISKAGGARLTQTGLLVGTPAYMSPEQGAGEAQLDGRTDIYSLGCVLYEMLAGDMPFTGPTALAVIAKRLTEPVPQLRLLRETVSDALEQVVMKALARAPADRFATAAEFGQALAAPSAAARFSRVPSPSVAVLPFANLSADPENEYFSDGMTEEIINRLTRVKALRVAARTSSFAFKGKGEDIRTIGQRLNVGTVLEGSIRKAGKRLRIATQLSDVADGYQRWSEQYDRELDDVFAIQEEIARAIVDVLEVELLGDEDRSVFERSTENPQAYEPYLKGRYHWNKRTESGIRRGIEFFERAIGHDPGYALALAGLADSFALLGVYGASAPSEVMPKARDFAEKALERDGSLAEAHTSLGLIKAVYDWDWPGAEREFRRAIEIAPRYPTSHHWYAINYLTPLGRFEEAAAEIKRAQALDPLSLAINASAGLQLFFARRCDEAIDEYRKTLEIDPDFAITHHFLGEAYTQKAMYQEAITEFQKAIALTGGDVDLTAAQAHAYAVSGRRSEAESLLHELVEEGKHRYVSPTLIAQVHVGLGDTEQAFAWLERAYEVRAADLLWLKVRPVFDPLRPAAGFAALLEKIGLT